ncbi:MAG: polysaccharide biosynthesis tyrosine autokinase [Bacteroidetes bacterium]|nr:polysaccharide biosynthesis tyrosine autokinase [Bacteroidota bacterium]
MSTDPLEVQKDQLQGAAGIDLKIGKIVLPYWPLYLGSLIIGVLIAFFIIKTTNPVFEVKGKILIKNDQDAVSSDRDMIQVEMFNSEKVIENELEILRSRGIIGDVVDELNLRVRWFKDNRSKDVLMGVDFPIQLIPLSKENFLQRGKFKVDIDWNKNQLKVLDQTINLNDTGVVMISNLPFKIDFRKPVSQEFKNYTYFLQIADFETSISECVSRLELSQRNKQSAIVDMRFIFPNYQTAKAFLEALVDQYIKQDIKEKKILGNGTLQFIEDRLNLLATQLDSVETNVEGYKVEHNIVDFKAQSGHNLTMLQNQKIELLDNDIQLSILAEVKNYLESKGNLMFTSPSVLGLNDPNLNGLLNQLHEKELKYSRDKKTLGIKDMGLQMSQDELESLRKQIGDLIVGMESNIRASRKTIQSEIDVRLRELAKVPGQEKSLTEITRQQEIKSSIFTFLLQKREEVAIALASEDSNLRVLEQPYGSMRSISPKRNIVFVIAILLSLMLPYVAMYIYDWLRGRLSSKVEIERLTGLSVVSQILYDNSKGSFVLSKLDRSPIAESIRSIRTRMMYVLNQKNSKVVFVCSAIPQEGKSFISTNLGIAFGLMGKKTLILGADLRKPQLHKTFNINNSKGLSTYLTGAESWQECIVEVDHENLHIFPAGPVPFNPSELLNSDLLRNLLKELKEKYDVIIVDTAPLALVSDAENMLSHEDTVLFVTRQNHTPKFVFKEVLEKLFKRGVHDVNVVFNGVRTKGFGYYYVYGDYRYSSTYTYSGYYGDTWGDEADDKLKKSDN